jgi:hypothetical protein
MQTEETAENTYTTQTHLLPNPLSFFLGKTNMTQKFLHGDGTRVDKKFLVLNSFWALSFT